MSLQNTIISVLVKGESMALDLFGTKFNLTRTELADKSEWIDIPVLDEEDEIRCEVSKLCFCSINTDLIRIHILNV